MGYEGVGLEDISGFISFQVGMQYPGGMWGPEFPGRDGFRMGCALRGFCVYRGRVSGFLWM